MHSREKKPIFVHALCCLFIVFGTVVLPQVARAQATIPGVPQPVVIINPEIITGIPTIAYATANAAADSNVNTFTTQVLNGLAWAVEKTAIQSITKSLVNWINSGYQGSPAFVTNLDQNLQDLGDGVANNFFDALQSNTGANVRSPFQDQVTQRLRSTYYGSTAKSAPNAGYNLNKYSNNPRAFLNGDFSQGGFDAWFAVVTNDQNNPIDAFHSQQNALANSVANVRTNQLHELDWGRGFISWRGDCIAPKATSAQTNADILSGQASPTALSSANNCSSYEIKTPGSVVENALGITVTSPLRQLELANSINEVVGAVASQLVNQVLGGTGLSGLGSPSAGGGTSFLAQATDPAQYSQGGSLANGFITNVASDQSHAQTYLASWQKLQTLAQNCTSSDPAVSSALSRSSTNVVRATTLLTSLAKISAEATSALTSTNPSAALASVSAEYQSLISLMRSSRARLRQPVQPRSTRRSRCFAVAGGNKRKP